MPLRRNAAVCAALSIMPSGQILGVSSAVTATTAAITLPANKAYSQDYETDDGQIKYKSKESNIFASDDSVEVHRRRLNNIVLDIWALTPFASSNPVPIMLSSENEDGTINISYCIGTPDKPDRSKESYFYSIDHNGTVSVMESNEILNLNDAQHLLAIATTIIRDVYGDYNTKEVIREYFESIVGDIE